MYFSPECSRAIGMGSLERIKRKFVSKFPGCPLGELDDLPRKNFLLPLQLSCSFESRVQSKFENRISTINQLT
jgi:hypothetical protein